MWPCLGDSYAEGLGDWKAQRKRIDEPFHSADIIHQITGRSILSFGHSAAGSAEGLVKLPVRALIAVNMPRAISIILMLTSLSHDVIEDGWNEASD